MTDSESPERQALRMALDVIYKLADQQAITDGWVVPKAQSINDVLAQPDSLAEWREKVAACLPYLKEGESPAECIARNRADTEMALGLLAKALKRAEAAEARVKALEAQALDAREAFRAGFCDSRPWWDFRQANGPALSEPEAWAAYLARKGQEPTR